MHLKLGRLGWINKIDKKKKENNTYVVIDMMKKIGEVFKKIKGENEMKGEIAEYL